MVGPKPWSVGPKMEASPHMAAKIPWYFPRSTGEKKMSPTMVKVRPNKFPAPVP